MLSILHHVNGALSNIYMVAGTPRHVNEALACIDVVESIAHHASGALSQHLRGGAILCHSTHMLSHKWTLIAHSFLWCGGDISCMQSGL